MHFVIQSYRDIFSFVFPKTQMQKMYYFTCHFPPSLLIICGFRLSLSLRLSSLWHAFFTSPHFQLLTKGCETSEMTLRRNGLGQLGFHVNYEGIVAEVSIRTLFRCLDVFIFFDRTFLKAKSTCALFALVELLNDNLTL